MTTHKAGGRSPRFGGRTSVYFFATLVTVLMSVLSPRLFAQASSEFHSTRIGLSAGMGVNYHNAQDIVNRINGSSIITQRVADFKSGVEFFGAISVPLSTDWAVKAEYVYLFASYTQGTIFGGNAEFSYAVHMPTLIGQYILYEASTYNFKVGVGCGYHFGSYSERYSLVDETFTGKGLGTLIELEGNTALGEDLYAHLGAQMRWDFIGDLKNSAGNSPSGATGTTSLHFFSVGARLGMSYYF